MRGNKRNGRHSRNRKNEADKPVMEPQSEEHEKIIEFLKTVKFRKKMIGGLDARSVWKKLDELNRLYDAAIRAEKIRGNTLLAEYKRAALSEISRRDAAIEQLRDSIAKGSPDSQTASESSDEKDEV